MKNLKGFRSYFQQRLRHCQLNF